MPKPKYKHFGKGVPKEVEEAYNKMLRHEAYVEECDIKNGLLHIEDCTFLPIDDDMSPQLVDPATVPKTFDEQIWLDRLEYLPIALERLKQEHPHYHELLTEYYLSDKKITLSEIAARKGMSYQAIHSILRNARRKMKLYIMIHENKG